MRPLPLRRLRRGAALALALGTGLAAASAHASGDECNAAYVETQQLRKAGHLRSARARALACAQDQCSVTVRRDCSAWLEAITLATPTLVIEARDEHGNELVDVSVVSADERLTERLDGKALAIDPGVHELRFEHAGRVEKLRLVALEGQAYRKVSVRFSPDQGFPLPAPKRAHAPEPRWVALPRTARAPEPDRSLPVASVIFGSVGAASLTAFGVLATSAYLSERDARRECQRECDARAVDGIHQRYLMADVALGFGVSSLVAAWTLWAFSSPSAPERGPQGLRLDVRGSQLSVEGTF